MRGCKQLAWSVLVFAVCAACSNGDDGSTRLPGVSDAGDSAGDAYETPAQDIANSDVQSAPNDTMAPDTPDSTTADVTAMVDSGIAADLSEPPPVGPGKLIVDPESYQFSYISPQEAMLTKQIAIFNGGTGPLVITGVSVKEGSSPEFGLIGVPPPNYKINPGKSTLAIARFWDSPQQEGDATIVIESDDPERPVAEVVLTSFLKASLPVPCAQLNPSSLGFGNVVRGDTKVMVAELTNCSADKPLSLTEITRSSGFFGSLTEVQITPEPTAPIEIAPGLPSRCRLATPLLADFGHFLVHTNDPETPKLQLDVSGVGVAPPLEQLGLSIKLSWDTDSTDVDSHLVEPGGTLFDCNTDCFFANPSPDWGVAGDWKDDPFLDLDDVDGYGPENINLTEPQSGVFTYTVHYWDDTWEGSSPQSTNATVELYNYGTKIAEFGPVGLDSTNRTWDVFTVEWPSLDI